MSETIIQRSNLPPADCADDADFSLAFIYLSKAMPQDEGVQLRAKFRRLGCWHIHKHTINNLREINISQNSYIFKYYYGKQ